MQFDPRTVAREIPGVLDEIFPHLTAAVVAQFNNSATKLPIQRFPHELLIDSGLQRAMLFELGCVVGEQRLAGDVNTDWTKCLTEAIRRQREYYDATAPSTLSPVDKLLSEIVGSNLHGALLHIASTTGKPIKIGPPIPGIEWISSGHGDFSAGLTLVEVKCNSKRFSSSDYRQVAIYWLLSYAAAVEHRGEEWMDILLLNPRSGEMVSLTPHSLLSAMSGGRAKPDLLQTFKTIIGSRLTR